LDGRNINLDVAASRKKEGGDNQRGGGYRGGRGGNRMQAGSVFLS